MNNKDIDLIRDAALALEYTDLELAQRLMQLAHSRRPSGIFIKNKLSRYNKKISEQSKQAIQKLVLKGELAIIPIGFRCYTKDWIKKNLNITQESLPFDVGFFSPFSVASILESQDFFKNGYTSHNVCIKNENHIDNDRGKGIKFETTTYTEINKLVESRKGQDIHNYLDSTYGYYTLDNYHKFVLAHYNWHQFADISKSKGIFNPRENLPKIKTLLTRRFSRMKEKIEQAKLVVFIYLNKKDNQYMKIDKEFYALDELSLIEKACAKVLNKESIVLDVSEGENISSSVLLDLIKDKIN
jgi:hypothetical protein